MKKIALKTETKKTLLILKTIKGFATVDETVDYLLQFHNKQKSELTSE